MCLTRPKRERKKNEKDFSSTKETKQKKRLVGCLWGVFTIHHHEKRRKNSIKMKKEKKSIEYGEGIKPRNETEKKNVRHSQIISHTHTHTIVPIIDKQGFGTQYILEHNCGTTIF